MPESILAEAAPFIFINYRVADGGRDAERLKKELVECFGEKAVFLDNANLEGGDTWTEELERRAKLCAVMLVLIGDSWLKAEFPQGHPRAGTPRLLDPEDWVRREINCALDAERPVIPLKLGSEMPPKEALKLYGLDRLPTKHHLILDFRDWDHTVANLIGRVEQFGLHRRASGGGNLALSKSARYSLPAEDLGMHLYVERATYQRELEAIHERMVAEAAEGEGRETVRVIALQGPPGIGKSLLARWFARRVQGDFNQLLYLEDDGSDDLGQRLQTAVCWAFQQYDEKQEESGLLEVDEQEGSEVPSFVVVLDGLQQAVHLRAIDRPCRRVIIVTSQSQPILQQLHCPRETLVIDAMTEEEAVALLRKTADSDLPEGSSEHAAARRLSELVEAHPLALSIAGTNANMLGGFEAMVDEWHSGTPLRPDPEIDSLYDLLVTVLDGYERRPGGQGIKRFFALLAACAPTGFDEESAGSAAGVSVPEARDRLRYLQARGLVERRQAEGRYDVQCRVYGVRSVFHVAAGRIGSDEEHSGAQRRHTTHWFERLQEHPWKPPNKPPALSLQEDDIAQALSRVGLLPSEPAVKLELLNQHFERSPRRVHDAVEGLAELARTAEGEGDLATWSLALIRRAKFVARGDRASAIASLHELTQKIESSALPEESRRERLVRCLTRYGSLLALDDLRGAIALLDRARELAGRLVDGELLAKAHDATARAYRRHDQHELALEHAELALKAWNACRGQDTWESQFLHALCLLEMVREDDAQEALGRLIEEFDVDDETSLMHLSTGLGREADNRKTAARGATDTEEASRHRRAALLLLAHRETLFNRAIGSGQPGVHQVIGWFATALLLVEEGRIDAALDNYERVANHAAELYEIHRIGGALRALRSQLVQSGDEVRAGRATHVLGMLADHSDPNRAATMCNILAKEAYREGRYDDAETSYQRQLELSIQHGLAKQSAYATLGLAAVAYKREQYQGAVECCERSLEACEAYEGPSSRQKAPVLHRRALSQLQLAGQAGDEPTRVGLLKLAVDDVLQVQALARVPGPRNALVSGLPKSMVAMAGKRMMLDALERELQRRQRSASSSDEDEAIGLSQIAKHLAATRKERGEPGDYSWLRPYLLRIDFAHRAGLRDEFDCHYQYCQLIKKQTQDRAVLAALATRGSRQAGETMELTLKIDDAMHARWQRSGIDMADFERRVGEVPFPHFRADLLYKLGRLSSTWEDKIRLHRASRDAALSCHNRIVHGKAVGRLFLDTVGSKRDAEALEWLRELANGAILAAEDLDQVLECAKQLHTLALQVPPGTEAGPRREQIKALMARALDRLENSDIADKRSRANGLRRGHWWIEMPEDPVSDSAPQREFSPPGAFLNGEETDAPLVSASLADSGGAQRRQID